MQAMDTDTYIMVMDKVTRHIIIITMVISIIIGMLDMAMAQDTDMVMVMVTAMATVKNQNLSIMVEGKNTSTKRNNEFLFW